MWADVLTKPLQGQKFRDMHAFLQNFSRNYDNDFEHEEDKGGPAQHLMAHQVVTNASSWECVGEQSKPWHQLQRYDSQESSDGRGYHTPLTHRGLDREELRVPWHSFDSREPIIASPTSNVILLFLNSSHGPQGGDSMAEMGVAGGEKVAAGLTLLLNRT